MSGDVSKMGKERDVVINIIRLKMKYIFYRISDR